MRKTLNTMLYKAYFDAGFAICLFIIVIGLCCINLFHMVNPFLVLQSVSHICTKDEELYLLLTNQNMVETICIV